MIKELKISEIVPNPDQPRKHFDEQSLNELAESIVSDGLQEPILVRPKDGKYEIVQGERRYRAHLIASLDTVQAKIKEVNDEDAFHLAVIENIQREQLTPIEEARAFQRYIELGYTHENIAKKVSKSRTYVTSRLRLLKLIPEIQDWIAECRISEGHAKQILKLKNELPAAEDNEKPFIAAQEQFIFEFKNSEKISVNDVSDWATTLIKKLIVAIIGVFKGNAKEIRNKLEVCDLLDITIKDLKKEHIELLIDSAIANLKPGEKRSDVYSYYEELENYIFNFKGDLMEVWASNSLKIHETVIKESLSDIHKAKESLVDAYKRASEMETGDSSRSLFDESERIKAMSFEEFTDYALKNVSRDTK